MDGYEGKVVKWVRGEGRKTEARKSGGEKRKSRTEQKASDEHQLFKVQPFKLFAIA